MMGRQVQFILRLASILGLVLALTTSGAPSVSTATAAQRTSVEIHLLWRLGCPFCEQARAFLDRLKREEPGIEVRDWVISGSETNRLLFIAVSRALNIERPAVPIVVVGDRTFVGYLGDSTTGSAIRATIGWSRYNESRRTGPQCWD